VFLLDRFLVGLFEVYLQQFPFPGALRWLKKVSEGLACLL
jgi:hypothetical protein